MDVYKYNPRTSNGRSVVIKHKYACGSVTLVGGKSHRTSATNYLTPTCTSHKSARRTSYIGCCSKRTKKLNNIMRLLGIAKQKRIIKK